jgi:hypothetical protein
MGITHLSGLEVAGVPTMGVGGSIPLGPRTFFVDSQTGSNGNTGAYDNPLATLDFAIGKCRAGYGDNVVMKQGHAETITGVGGVTADVADISIIGLGTGAQRPRLLMDGAATVTFLITAAGVTVSNFIMAAGHADIVAGIGVSAAGVTINAIEFVNNVADENFLTEIKCTSTTDGNADNLTVTNCRAFTIDAGALEFIEINADLDGATIKNNFVCKDAATAGKFILQATGKDLRNLDCGYNVHMTGMTTGDLFIDNDTTVNSGVVYNNLIGSHDTAAPVTVDCDGVRQFLNYSAASDTASGRLWPAVETT